jgi:hypothetical protein
MPAILIGSWARPGARQAISLGKTHYAWDKPAIRLD